MDAGFLLVWLGILRAEDSRVLSLLCVNLLLPCAILKSFQADYTAEIQSGFLLAMAAALVSQLLLLGIAYGISAVKKLDAVELGSIIYPNSANLILPLVTVSPARPRNPPDLPAESESLRHR